MSSRLRRYGLTYPGKEKYPSAATKIVHAPCYQSSAPSGAKMSWQW